MKLEKETSIYQPGAIGGIQTTAESKNSVFYQATAPSTTGRKVNDIWYDSDDGNAMYKFDGTQWSLQQFGTNAIVAGSITTAKVNTTDLYTNFLLTNFVQAAQASFSTLSAITADIGICTAGKIQSSDYSYSSGNYSTTGMQIDLAGKTYRTPKTAILADGSIYTTSGEIGGWTIEAQAIAKETSNGDYRVRLQAPNGATSSNYALRVDEYDSTAHDWTNLLALTYGGAIVAKKGTIAGWNLSSDAFYRSSSIFGSPNGLYFGTNGLSITDKFTVTSAGALTATSGTIGGFTLNNISLQSSITLSSTTFTSIIRSTPSSSDDSIIAVTATANNVTTTNFSVSYDGVVEASAFFIPDPSNSSAWYLRTYSGVDYTYIDTFELGRGLSLNASNKAHVSVFAKTNNTGSCVLQAYDANDNAYGFLINPTDGIIANGAIHATGSVFTNSRTSYSDGQTGVAVHSNGNVYASGAIGTGGKTAYNTATAGAWISNGKVYLTGDANDGAYIYFYYNKGTTETAYIRESASGVISIVASNGFKVQNVYDATGSYAANVFVQSDGRIMRSTTSSKRYKHDIRPLEDYKKILDIPAVSFVYNGDYLDASDQRYMKDIPGFIAEDVASAYPIAADIVNGKIEDWNFRYIIPPMLAVEQDHERRITALENALKGEK